MMNSPSARYLLTGLLFALLWSSASSMGKIDLQSVEGLVLFTIRFFIAGILLLAYSTFIQRDRFPQKKEWLHLIVFGSLNTALYLGIFIIALEEVTAGVTSIALALNPLIIGALTAVWLKRPVLRIQWISIVIGILGVVIVSYPLLINSYATITGLTLMAVCMVSYSVGSVYYTSISWKLSRTAINGWQVLMGAVLLCPFALLVNNKTNHFDARFWFSVFWLVIPVSIGAVQLWLFLLRQDAVRASMWLFLCPIFGLLFAYTLLDEPISSFTYIGTGFVMAALFMGQRAMNQRV